MALECEVLSYDEETCRLVGVSSMSALMNRYWVKTEELMPQSCILSLLSL